MGTFIAGIIIFCFIAAYSRIIAAICLGLLAMLANETFFLGVAIACLSYFVIDLVIKQSKV